MINSDIYIYILPNICKEERASVGSCTLEAAARIPAHIELLQQKEVHARVREASKKNGTQKKKKKKKM